MTKHIFQNAIQPDGIEPNSVALYLRVSTGRQAANDVSLPSQRDVTRSHCETNGWIVVEEFVEAATERYTRAERCVFAIATRRHQVPLRDQRLDRRRGVCRGRHRD